MMASFPALPLWTDAYLADTMHLDCLESGAYLHLLIAAWRAPDCSLPNDDKLLARYAKCTPRQWSKVKDVVLSFWTTSGTKLVQSRLIKERTFVTAKREQQKQAGKASALKRNETTSTDVDSTLQPDRNGEVNETSTPIPIPTPIKKKEDTNVSSKKSDFENWWKVYPKHVAKLAASKAYEKALKTTSAGSLLASAKAYASEVYGKEAQFIKNPATWLDGGCWMDNERAAPTPESLEDAKAAARENAIAMARTELSMVIRRFDPNGWETGGRFAEIAAKWKLEKELISKIASEIRYGENAMHLDQAEAI